MDRCQAHSLDALGMARTQHTHPLNALPPHTHTHTHTHLHLTLAPCRSVETLLQRASLLPSWCPDRGFVFFCVCVCCHSSSFVACRWCFASGCCILLSFGEELSDLVVGLHTGRDAYQTLPLIATLKMVSFGL